MPPHGDDDGTSAACSVTPGEFALPQPLVDLRGLEPPEPLMHVLEAVEADDGPHCFLLSREPLPLYAVLAAAGWKCTASRDSRGVLVTVTRR